MNNNIQAVSFVLYGHVPFVRHIDGAFPAQEKWFFNAVSETYIPLLEVFDRLDRDHVPFRMGLCLSPTLCHMLTDELLVERYLDYTNRQIEFGIQEMERTLDNPELNALARHFYGRILEKRMLFTGRYGKNLLGGFDYYQKKGRLELLAGSATHAFLPFYGACPEAIQAELEVSISSYRTCFGKYPQGFWLPELGWTAELDSWLRSYNFGYTLVDAHALAFARPPAEKGSFFPARTPQGVVVFGRDFYASEEMASLASDPAFRMNKRDRGFELPSEELKLFLGPQGGRTGTGYKYWAYGSDGAGDELYAPEAAAGKAAEKARAFLDSARTRLKAASAFMDGCPLSLCAFEADSFGRFWHEGPLFIEALFREGTADGDVCFFTPSEYLCRLDTGSFQTVSPGFSSWGVNGYAETWLDASNDWAYRHAMRALDRMVELAERFPDSTGLKERALNQAAREILLSLGSDWSKMLYKQENADYARNHMEASLRNFTTIYEALGSNYISTEWLTYLERLHNIFPLINYRVFRRKR